jgi:hypothetical protein
MNYDEDNYHSHKYGYQNVTNAQKFADFVVADLINKYPDAKAKPVLLLTMDTSSVFLSTFVKILMPHWVLISGDKQFGHFKHLYFGDDAIASVFVDDFICSGNTITLVLDALRERPSLLKNDSIEFYFIKQDSHRNAEYRIRQENPDIILTFNVMMVDKVII